MTSKEVSMRKVKQVREEVSQNIDTMSKCKGAKGGASEGYLKYANSNSNCACKYSLPHTPTIC